MSKNPIDHLEYQEIEENAGMIQKFINPILYSNIQIVAKYLNSGKTKIIVKTIKVVKTDLVAMIQIVLKQVY